MRHLYNTPQGIQEIFPEEKGQKELIQDNWVKLTEAEVEEFLNPPKTPEEIALEEHEQKSNLIDTYVDTLTITTESGKVFKANYSALTSMDIILKGDYPDGVIPIWKQNINGTLTYYEDVPLNELSEVITEANKRIQAKHAEVFLGLPNPYEV